MYLQSDRGNKITKIIKDHFYSFFDTYKVKEQEARLPLNQLFLDFPHNTIHFWEKNPFESGALRPEIHDNYDYYTALSFCCLKKLSNEDNWNDSLTFHIYIELLPVLNSYIQHEYGVDAVSIFHQLTESFKSKAGDRANLVDKFLGQGRSFYREHKPEIDGYFEEVKKQVEATNNVHHGPIIDWLNVIRKKKNPPAHQTTYYEMAEFVKGLILDVGGKIDLSHKGLIQAISVVSEAGTKAKIVN